MYVKEFLHCSVTLILVLLLNRTQDLKTKSFLRVALSTHSLEKGIATHSSILAWRIPWTEDPGGLQSEGLQSWTWPSTTATHSLVKSTDVSLLICEKHTCLRILEMSKMNKKVTNALGVYNLLLPALLSQSTSILNLLYLPFFCGPSCF